MDTLRGSKSRGNAAASPKEFKIDDVRLNAIIFGGGVAGLWLLDRLRCDGRAAWLIEASQLGSGQTVAAQGIIHGGVKYALAGKVTNSARSIRDLPQLWRDCLDGNRSPDLSDVRRRADSCVLWRTDSVKSRLGMLGARVGLQVTPQTLSKGERPALLHACPGVVARLDEQVIDPISMVESLARPNRDSILRVDRNAVRFNVNGDVVESIEFSHGGASIRVRPDLVVLAAGEGNADLLSAVGRTAPAMQRRPLHMVVVRNQDKTGPLQPVNGHCVDGARTRVTVTTDVDDAGRVTWQLGGEVAERTIDHEPMDAIRHARRELVACIPQLNLRGVEWATYRVNRAEQATGDGRRPEDAGMIASGNVVAAWPTKMVLAPVLTDRIIEASADRMQDIGAGASPPRDWPRPMVSPFPWLNASWIPDDVVTAPRTAAPGS